MEGQRGKRYITWIDKREEMNEGTADIELLSLGIHTTRFEILNLFVGKQINACLVVFITMHIDIATCALLIIKLDISEWKYITEKNFVADLLWLFRSFYLRRSSVESFVERYFFIRILFQVYVKLI
jgi:hypothetical protein